MANHAYLFSPNIPAAAEVEELLNEWLTARFGGIFKLERNGDSFMITSSCATPPIHDAVQMWISKWDDEHDEWKLEDGLDEKVDRYFEFRHGHGSDVWWWFESQVRAKLFDVFGGKSLDDGIGWYEQNPEDTLREYLKIRYSHPISGLLRFTLTKMQIAYIKQFNPEFKPLLKARAIPENQK